MTTTTKYRNIPAPSGADILMVDDVDILEPKEGRPTRSVKATMVLYDRVGVRIWRRGKFDDDALYKFDPPVRIVAAPVDKGSSPPPAFTNSIDSPLLTSSTPSAAAIAAIAGGSFSAAIAGQPAATAGASHHLTTTASQDGFSSSRQLRLFKDADDKSRPMCLVMSSCEKTADEWAFKVWAANRAYPEVPRNKQFINVWTGKGEEASHRIEAKPGLTVADVLDEVVHKIMGEIPSMYSLNWSFPQPQTTYWAVSDTPPVELLSFAGETLYLTQKNMKPAEAMREWLSEFSDPCAMEIITNQWASANEAKKKELEVILIKTSGVLNSHLLDTVYSICDCPFQFTPARLNELDSPILLREGQPMVTSLKVFNSGKKDIVVSLQQISEDPKGLCVSYYPRFLRLHSSETQSFSIQLIPGPSTQRKGSGHILFIVTGKGGKYDLKDTPYCLPYEWAIDEVPQQAAPVIHDTHIEFKETIALFDRSCTLRRAQMSDGEALVKFMPVRIDQDAKTKVIEDLNFIYAARHPNIVALTGYSIDQDVKVLSLYMPSYPGLDFTNDQKLVTVRDLIFSEHHIGWPLRIKVALDVANALAYYHLFGRTYGEIRPDGVLLISLRVKTPTAAGIHDVNALLCDVGSINGKSVLRLAERGEETPPVTAPELIGNPVARNSFSPLADSFHYSMFLYPLICRAPAFSETRRLWITVKELESRVVSEKLRPTLTNLPKECPSQLRDLMVHCWDENPSQRPTMQAIISTLHELLDAHLGRDVVHTPLPPSLFPCLSSAQRAIIAEAGGHIAPILETEPVPVADVTRQFSSAKLVFSDSPDLASDGSPRHENFCEVTVLSLHNNQSIVLGLLPRDSPHGFITSRLAKQASTLALLEDNKVKAVNEKSKLLLQKGSLVAGAPVTLYAVPQTSIVPISVSLNKTTVDCQVYTGATISQLRALIEYELIPRSEGTQVRLFGHRSEPLEGLNFTLEEYLTCFSSKTPGVLNFTVEEIPYTFVTWNATKKNIEMTQGGMLAKQLKDKAVILLKCQDPTALLCSEDGTLLDDRQLIKPGSNLFLLPPANTFHVSFEDQKRTYGRLGSDVVPSAAGIFRVCEEGLHLVLASQICLSGKDPLVPGTYSFRYVPETQLVKVKIQWKGLGSSPLLSNGEKDFQVLQTAQVKDVIAYISSVLQLSSTTKYILRTTDGTDVSDFSPLSSFSQHHFKLEAAPTSPASS